MVTKTYVIKADPTTGYSASTDCCTARLSEVAFFNPVKVICVDRDVPDSRFMREDLYSKEEVDKAFERGLRAGKKEGWGLARKLMLTPEDGGIGIAGIIAAFGDDACGYDIMKDLDVYVAENRYNKWRAHQEKVLEPGDIIVNNNGAKCIVTAAGSGYLYILYSDGSCGDYNKTNVKKQIEKDISLPDGWAKTGEKVDIEALLGKIKRDNPRWNGAE
jgi:hypothetical protein